MLVIVKPVYVNSNCWCLLSFIDQCVLCSMPCSKLLKTTGINPWTSQLFGFWIVKQAVYIAITLAIVIVPAHGSGQFGSTVLKCWVAQFGSIVWILSELCRGQCNRSMSMLGTHPLVKLTPCRSFSLCSVNRGWLSSLAWFSSVWFGSVLFVTMLVWTH